MKLRKPRPKADTRLTVTAVRQALLDIVAAVPDGADKRTVDEGLCNRYLDGGGQANCLLAEVLFNVGVPEEAMFELDRERPTGEILRPGVRVTESEHPLLTSLDPAVLKLLQYVQDHQDRGESWRSIVDGAFSRNWLTRHRRPWLSVKEEIAA